ncbi:MAG: hypothetical protein R3C05_21540 [Pirellulaceae bacterium]
MIRRQHAPILATLLCLAFSSSSQAQLTDSELFRVTVKPRMSIAAPTGTVSQFHDETDNNQNFPLQRWLVVSNHVAGATAVFETTQAFTHTVDSTYKRDASLSLSLVSGSTWNVTTPTATTAYASSDEVVSVAAESTGPGSAAFDLAVSLVEEAFADLAAGDYEMTVVGTLTAN